MSSEKTADQLAKERFFAEGNQLPICCNDGCNNSVIVRSWRYLSFKHYCNNCNTRMKEGLEPRDGVTFHKKNYCENIDGRLGFVCPIDPKFVWQNGDLHSDHKDGNHFNNASSNLQTLCSLCHSRKGHSSGDFNSSSKGRDLSKF